MKSHSGAELMERDAKRAGNVALEFVLVTVFLFVPLLLGLLDVGLDLAIKIQANQVARDVGHMFARAIDFSQPSNQDVIVRLARGLGLQRTGGEGVVILSEITFIGESQCTAAGLSLSDCVNYNMPVIRRRITIGNASLRQSRFGTPDADLLDASGYVLNYLTEPSARAVPFSQLMALEPGEVAYVVETYFRTPDLGIAGVSSGGGVYAMAIF